MFLFHRNNTGGGASGEQRGRGVGMSRMLIVLIVLIVLIAHISMVMNFSPVLQPPFSPVTGYPALFSCGSATNTADTSHLQVLYTGTVCSSPRTFFRKGGEREKKNL